MSEISYVVPIDIETGEISEEHYVRSRKQDEAWRKKQRQTADGRKHEFTNSDMDNIPEIINELTNRQLGFLLLLQTRVEYDGIIRNANSTPMTVTDMIAFTKANRRTFYDFLKRCKSLGIIEEKDGSYHVNSAYHWKGSMDGRSVVKSMMARLADAYIDVKPEDIGMLYRLMPYIHWSTNALCSNPSEEKAENVRPLKAKEIAKICGVSPSYLSTKTRTMTFGNEYAFAKVSVGDSRTYMINPWVLRRTEAVEETLEMIFSVKKFN